jgi:hypothetical protein
MSELKIIANSHAIPAIAASFQFSIRASAETGALKIVRTVPGQFALHPISATALRKSGLEIRQTPSGKSSVRRIVQTLSEQSASH